VSDCAIASTIISMGRKLGHRVIAEGVETVEQMEFLRQAGCDEVQGYLYGKPLPAYDFREGVAGELVACRVASFPRRREPKFACAVDSAKPA
jgi:EAL domain-containing protein (putative c-di-GMP-specific phosphodiesterase class I)